MVRYAGTAEKTAQRIASAYAEKEQEALAVLQTADNLVGNLIELADDLNAAFDKHMPKSQIRFKAEQWVREGGNISGRVAIEGIVNGEVAILVPFGNGDITVNGAVVPRGDSAMGAINREIIKILEPA